MRRFTTRCCNAGRAPELRDSLQREDASFFEQLYGECRPYLDVDKELPSGDSNALLDDR